MKEMITMQKKIDELNEDQPVKFREENTKNKIGSKKFKHPNTKLKIKQQIFEVITTKLTKEYVEKLLMKKAKKADRATISPEGVKKFLIDPTENDH